jgi:hypothetical protein
MSAKCSKSLVKTSFTIQNNSGKSLYYVFTTTYPDTSIPPYIPYAIVIDPYKTGGPFLYSVSSNSGIVEVFLLDSTIVATNPWDSVVAKYMVLKRYDLTTDSLNKLNGIITYP